MTNINKLWKDQCQATLGIKEEFGLESALLYLIGEKFMNHLLISEHSEDHREELHDFANAIRCVFQPSEIKEFFDDPKNFPDLILDDEGQRDLDDLMRGAKEDEIEELSEGMNPVANAEKILRIENAKALLIT